MMGGNQLACDSPMMERRANLTERLKDQKASLEKRLSEVSAAVAALEKNPELQTLLDLVSKVY